MKWITRWSLLAAFVAALGFGTGCSEDDGSSNGGGTPADDAGGGRGGGDTSGGGGSDATTDDTGGGGSESAVHTDTAYRVNLVSVTKPGAVAPTLTNLVQTAIEDGEIHIIIDLRNIGATSGDTTLELTGNAAEPAEAEGEYMWAPDAEVNYVGGTLSADGAFENTSATELGFPVSIPGSDPPERIIVPVKEVVINGDLSTEDSGTLVMDATLNGVILEEDADVIEVDLGGSSIILSDLLGAGSKDWPEDAEAKTGWILQANIVAEESTLVE